MRTSFKNGPLLDEKKLDFFFCCFGDDDVSSTELPEITEPEPATMAGAGAVSSVFLCVFIRWSREDLGSDFHIWNPNFLSYRVTPQVCEFISLNLIW